MRLLPNLIIIKKDDYDNERKRIEKEHIEEIEKIRKNNAAYVGTLADEKKRIEEKIKSLEQKHVKDIQYHIDIEYDLNDKIADLEEQVKLLDIKINSLKKSNAGYKANNSKLKNIVQGLREELSTCYKYKRLPADKSKSKNTMKVKNTSKESKIVRRMNI